MHSFLKTGLGWGIIIIILTQCTAARAAPMQANDSLILSPPGEMDHTLIPEAFSFLGAGATTLVYGASTWFSKTYLINLGDVETRLTKDTSDSCEAISTQDGLCKKDPALCPMFHLNKINYGSAIRKNSQTSSALGLVCETKQRRSSTETIKLCTEGKDWLVPEYATGSTTKTPMWRLCLKLAFRI